MVELFLLLDMDPEYKLYAENQKSTPHPLTPDEKLTSLEIHTGQNLDKKSEKKTKFLQMNKAGNVWLKATYDEKDKPPITEISIFDAEVDKNGHLFQVKVRFSFLCFTPLDQRQERLQQCQNQPIRLAPSRDPPHQIRVQAEVVPEDRHPSPSVQELRWRISASVRKPSKVGHTTENVHENQDSRR